MKNYCTIKMKSEIIDNILKSEFQSQAQLQGFETFETETVQKLKDVEKFLISKSLTEELNEEESIQLDICKAEIGSLSIAQVINDESLKKEPLFYRNKDSYLEKGGHKYFKREGTPGKYKYYYTEAQYKKEKGDSGEKKDSDSPKGESNPTESKESGSNLKLNANRPDYKSGNNFTVNYLGDHKSLSISVNSSAG